ncbi:hypothetical protein HD598_001424 [Neomicrococcus aestuarii]|uniref:Uncharacterized protein n=1 Tax=Neomicrococcus aestuarii TaxID=556325 RepID=A0A7W8WZZ4_9MICC|nr:hypothetical protein [Neomicrococcus aestuarii]MBB5512737.1 hypothetical protein [Neomicrococcus aestuarii]
MRVQVTRSGGFAGISRRGAIECSNEPDLSALVDAALLEAQQSQDQNQNQNQNHADHPLPDPTLTDDDGETEAASSYSERNRAQQHQQRDRYQWNIWIGDEQFEFPDSELPETVRVLAVEVLKHPVTRPTMDGDLDH